MDENFIREVKEDYKSKLLDYRGVVGVGIGRIRDKKGDNQTGIIVDVEEKLPEHKQIPSSVEDVPVEIREVGKIKAL